MKIAAVQWLLQVQGEAGSIESLCTVDTSTVSFARIKPEEAELHYGPADSLSEPQDAYNLLGHVLAVANAAAQLKLGPSSGFTSATSGALIHVDKNGNRGATLFSPFAGRIRLRDPEAELAELILVALDDDGIAKAVEHLAAGGGWDQLYRAFEALEVAGVIPMELGVASKARLDLFTKTANAMRHPEKTANQTIGKLMRLDEAQHLIEQLLIRALEQRLIDK